MKQYNEEILRLDIAANFGRNYQQCTLSVMDTIADPSIKFDENGVSNYFRSYHEQADAFVFKDDEGSKKLEELISKIKASGKGKPFDCITGVSGGVDSTYLALMAKKWGLRPLIVHFDNGWNSEIAVKNIENIITKLGFDLYTLVVDWEEFRDIQMSYLKASVVDIEAITDHAIIGTLYKLANKHGIKYILSGSNIVTEATLPLAWIWNKTDHVNIVDIHKRYGKIPLKTFPLFSTRQKKIFQAKGIETVAPLNFVHYDKTKVKEIITTELSWKDYGGKHYESIWTRFYQGYILPAKFGIDKRKAHLSNLIFSKQISKEKALEELAQPIYEQSTLEQDYEFVLKKFNISALEFEEIMNLPVNKHSDFKTERSIWERYPILAPLRPIWRVLGN